LQTVAKRFKRKGKRQNDNARQIILGQGIPKQQTRACCHQRIPKRHNRCQQCIHHTAPGKVIGAQEAEAHDVVSHHGWEDHHP